MLQSLAAAALKPQLCLALACLSGPTAVLAVFMWPFFDRRRTALGIQCFGAGAFAMHFVPIGAETAAASSGVAVLQLLAAAFLTRRPALLAVYAGSLAALLVLAVMSWGGVPSLLAVFGSLIGTMARLQRSTARMKVLFVCSAPLWAAHNLLVGSTFGLAVGAVSIGGNALALARWSVRRQRRVVTSTNSGSRTPAPSLRWFGKQQGHVVAFADGRIPGAILLAE